MLELRAVQAVLVLGSQPRLRDESGHEQVLDADPSPVRVARLRPEYPVENLLDGEGHGRQGHELLCVLSREGKTGVNCGTDRGLSHSCNAIMRIPTLRIAALHITTLCITTLHIYSWIPVAYLTTGESCSRCLVDSAHALQTPRGNGCGVGPDSPMSRERCRRPSRAGCDQMQAPESQRAPACDSHMAACTSSAACVAAGRAGSRCTHVRVVHALRLEWREAQAGVLVLRDLNPIFIAQHHVAGVQPGPPHRMRFAGRAPHRGSQRRVGELSLTPSTAAPAPESTPWPPESASSTAR